MDEAKAGESKGGEDYIEANGDTWSRQNLEGTLPTALSSIQFEAEAKSEPRDVPCAKEDSRFAPGKELKAGAPDFKAGSDNSGGRYSAASTLTTVERPRLERIVLKFTTLSDGNEQSSFTVGRQGRVVTLVRKKRNTRTFNPPSLLFLFLYSLNFEYQFLRSNSYFRLAFLCVFVA